MRVAALYDVHGNLPALEAVLAEIPDDAAIVVGGDVPRPAACPQRRSSGCGLLGERVRWIRGNADRELKPGEEGLAPPDVIEWVESSSRRSRSTFLHALPRAPRARRRRSSGA